jgi:hypothetical protein
MVRVRIRVAICVAEAFSVWTQLMVRVRVRVAICVAESLQCLDAIYSANR